MPAMRPDVPMAQEPLRLKERNTTRMTESPIGPIGMRRVASGKAYRGLFVIYITDSKLLFDYFADFSYNNVGFFEPSVF